MKYTTGKATAMSMAKNIADMIRRHPSHLELNQGRVVELTGELKKEAGTDGLYSGVSVRIRVVLADTEISHSIFVPVHLMMSEITAHAAESQIGQFLNDVLTYVKHREFTMLEMQSNY